MVGVSGPGFNGLDYGISGGGCVPLCAKMIRKRKGRIPARSFSLCIGRRCPKRLDGKNSYALLCATLLEVISVHAI